VVAAARNWGVVAIGYRAGGSGAESGTLSGGIRINPPKSEKIEFHAGDVVVVIANTGA
jgi:hypothetical protein